MVTTLKIVGGDPALDLVNTVGDDRVPDPLAGYGSFVAWAARAGVIDDDVARRLAARGADRPAVAGRALREARELRAILDAVFRPLAIAGGGAPAGGDERAPAGSAEGAPAGSAEGAPARGDDGGAAVDERLVRRAGAAVERGRLVRGRDGAFRLAWDGDHLERPLWPLAVAALDLLRDGPLDRLKACEDCPWLFLDTSRNHSRRWCSMDDCGSRSKMRRYRARRATAGR